MRSFCFSWLPSSYNGACGSISYMLESRLNVGGKIDQIVQLPLTVVNTLSMINVYTPVLQVRWFLNVSLLFYWLL